MGDPLEAARALLERLRDARPLTAGDHVRALDQARQLHDLVERQRRGLRRRRLTDTEIAESRAKIEAAAKAFRSANPSASRASAVRWIARHTGLPPRRVGSILKEIATHVHVSRGAYGQIDP